MFWLLIAFISPVLHGLSNIIDEYFVNKIFKNIRVLIFFVSLLNFILGLIIFLIKRPNLPPISVLPFLIIISLIEILYFIPYCLALKSSDTSIVASMFSLGNILVPVLAFFIVGESLQFHQYLGFFIIILSSFLLSFDSKKKFKINVSLLYMFLCSLMLSVETVLYKYVCTIYDWANGFVWIIFISFAFIFIFFLISKKYRNEIKKEFPKFKQNSKLLIFEQLLTFIGELSAAYVISLIPITLEKGISASQPIFVLLYAVILNRFFPNVFKENVDKKSILKKIVLFILIITGITLTIK
jgi:drug/metabolite transporter (DMT)-like permease